MKSYVLFLLIFFLPFFSYAEEAKGSIVLVVGTRPEAIKVIPVYYALKEANLPVLLCSTGQHKELLDEIFTLFNITPDFDLKIMKAGQDLFYVTEQVLQKTREVFEEVKPSLVIVQGDTTTAMSASLAAFYLKIPVGHIEAGLRTHDIYAPFPEEMNRLIISKISVLNFAPTKHAALKLKEEGVDEKTIFITGNTVVDSLYSIKNKMDKKEILPRNTLVEIVDEVHKKNGKLVLLTAHRRENFGENLKTIFESVKTALKKYPDLYFVYPMHPNPNIKQAFDLVFTSHEKRIFLLPPLPYHDLNYLLSEVDAVLTDSGGIQEEAISLNKPTLVLRNETDRPEGLKKGISALVGNHPEKIQSGISKVMDDKINYLQFKSPYGDGFAAKKIAAIVEKFYNNP